MTRKSPTSQPSEELDVPFVPHTPHPRQKEFDRIFAPPAPSEERAFALSRRHATQCVQSSLYARLRQAYPAPAGRTIFPFRRIFAVAAR